MLLEKKEPIIIIAAGKANSGKDTTCEFIHNYVKIKDLKVINLQLSYYIKMYAKNMTDWDGSEDTKPRNLLSELGTEIIRNKIDSNFFINRIIGDIMVYSYYFDVITISDARFAIELDTLASKFNNVYKVNITRPNFDNNLDSKQKAHATETGLDNYDNYDYKIVNDGTLDDLNNKVIDMLKEIL